MAAAVVVSVVARTASVSIVLGLESVVLGVGKRESTVRWPGDGDGID